MDTVLILALLSPGCKSGLWLDVNSFLLEFVTSGLKVERIIKFSIGLYSKYKVPNRLLVVVSSISSFDVATGLLNGFPVTSLAPLNEPSSLYIGWVRKIPSRPP